MKNGNSSRVGRRRRRTGASGAQAGNHRAGSRGSTYNGRRRKEATHAYSVLLLDNHLFDRLREHRFTRMHLVVAGAVSLVLAVGVAIVLGNLSGGEAAEGIEDAAFLYEDGKALPADFAETHPSLMEQIYSELETRYGLTEDDLYDESTRPDGLRVVLTLDRDLQDAAEETSGEAGVVAVEPGTGAVLAYYGAEAATGTDLVGDASPHAPSGVFDMITSATALEAGASIDSWWSTDDEENVTLVQAVQQSNTVAMDAVADEYGVEEVLGVAKALGLTAIADAEGELRDLDSADYSGLTAADLPSYGVTVLDMASVYATIAAGGTYAETHFVAGVIDSGDAEVAPDQEIQTSRAVAETTAQDLQYMGLNESEAIEDRDYFAVGSDFYGTVTESWFVGAIPQVSVAAWASGEAAGDGGVSLWRNVIDAAIEANGYEAEDLPGASGAGDDLTEGIADDDGQIDPDSEYCQSNPDEAACSASPSESESSESPAETESSSEEPEEPDPTTSSEEEPDPTTESPTEEETTCAWIWC